jgi:hypothetical protein
MFTKIYSRAQGVSRLWPDMSRPYNQVFAVAVATAAALFIRLHHLSAPLNSQEVYTWDFSHQSFGFIFGRLVNIETNPPFYYLLMKIVMFLGGESERLLRLPSVAAGTIAIPLIYILGRLGGIPRSGVMGAFLLALNAVAIFYSREARTYALLQDVCLIAAIGAVLVIRSYWSRGGVVVEPARYERLGWILFSCACVGGFYLHYTFLFEICALECAIAAGLFQAWLSGNGRVGRVVLRRWAASCAFILLLTAWGVYLMLSLKASDNIGYLKTPSLGNAIHTLVRVDGFRDLSKFEPLPSLIFFAIAGAGFLRGWRRSNAVLVSGALFALFPLILFAVSQHRPIYEERTLAAPTFAACLLTGYGALSLGTWLLSHARAETFHRLAGGGRNWAWSHLVPAAPYAAILLVALASASNSARGRAIDEPYDKATRFLAKVMREGDVAAGTDGIIYYRRKLGANFSYFKLAEGQTAESLVTYASHPVQSRDVLALTSSEHSVYVVLRDKIGLTIAGRTYPSYSNYVLQILRHREPPVASFAGLSVYRLPGQGPDDDDSDGESMSRARAR